MKDRSFDKRGTKTERGTIVYTYTPPEVMNKTREIENMLDPEEEKLHVADNGR